MINQSLVVGNIVFTNTRDRCLYFGTVTRLQAKWLADHPGSWSYVRDNPQEAGLLAKTEIETGTVEAEPNVQKNGDDDDDDIPLVDTLGGDRSPPHPTLLPTPVTATIANGTTKAEPLRGANAAVSEATGSKTETTPLGAMGRKRGLSGGRQLKKQKLPAEVSKAGRKLSPERMRIVIESLKEYPILDHAASKAGIHRKTLEYWIKCSKAGNDGYDIEMSEGEIWRFHEECEAAKDEADDILIAAAHAIAMGGVVYKTDQSLVDRGYQGTDAYLRDENGNPVVETIRNPNGKMLRWLLERLRPEKYGKHRPIDATHKGGGVLVVGATPKKRKNSTATAASIRVRKWKAASRMIREVKS